MDSRTATPPSLEDLKSALAQLRPVRPVEAALHLSLPIDEVVGIGARKFRRGWQWREAKVETRSLDNALLLTRLGWQERDEFVSLAAAPSSWVKPIRSGAHVVLFGTDLLFDLPRILTAPSLEMAPGDILELVETGELAPGKESRGVKVTSGPLGWVLAPA